MGDGGRFPLETWFWEMPICTRWWTTATVLTSALVQCQMVTPFQLFYSFRAVFAKSQVCLPLSAPLFYQVSSRCISRWSHPFVSMSGVFLAHSLVVLATALRRLSRRREADHLTTVLASPDHFPLLRPIFARSPVPCLLPPTIRPAPRGIIWAFTCSFLLAAGLRHD